MNKIVDGKRRRTWAEIDLDAAEYNLKKVKESASTKLCCVIKANAYGHGAIQLARLYQEIGVDYLAVSNIEEAIQLRRNGVYLPILILGYTSCDCAKLLAENDITQCVYSYEYGKQLAWNALKENVIVKIHIKIDTGMGRIGFLCRSSCVNEIDKAVEVCKLQHLNVEGVFTHFAVADESNVGKAYTQEQFNCFVNAIDIFKQCGVEFKIRHCANSAAIFDYPETHLDMVRAGVVLYGLKPSEEVKNLPELKCVMSVHSVIAHIKTVMPGQTISYGRTYMATLNKKIATVPIGYADGFRRMNGKYGYCLLVNGKPARIVGRVCMDQLMIDVTDIDCNVGDEVIVFGDGQYSTANEIAKLNGTINYEIVCDVGERVPRAYMRHGDIIEWQDNILGE